MKARQTPTRKELAKNRPHHPFPTNGIATTPIPHFPAANNPTEWTTHDLWTNLHMIPNPLREVIAASPEAKEIPQSWFHTLPIGHYKPIHREFASLLLTANRPLLRAFIVADLNLLARDLRLHLLMFRGFARAKYGMRSEVMAPLLGVESIAQLLSRLQNCVRTNGEFQSNTLPEQTPRPNPSVPTAPNHFLQKALHKQFPTSDHLFHYTPGIQPIHTDHPPFSAQIPELALPNTIARRIPTTESTHHRNHPESMWGAERDGTTPSVDADASAPGNRLVQKPIFAFMSLGQGAPPHSQKAPSPDPQCVSTGKDADYSEAHESP